jgi:hypothetical protein
MEYMILKVVINDGTGILKQCEQELFGVNYNLMFYI